MQLSNPPHAFYLDSNVVVLVVTFVIDMVLDSIAPDLHPPSSQPYHDTRSPHLTLGLATSHPTFALLITIAP